MSVRILGGICKGFVLSVPKGDITRPTSILLRRRIFDSFQNLSNFIFVDACAGTGAMGTEAWSRNAKRIYFIEKDKKTYKILQKNIGKLEQSFNEETNKRPLKLLNKDLIDWLKNFRRLYNSWSEAEKRNTIFFFDPPYTLIELYQKVIITELWGKKWFKGTLWVESDKKKGPDLIFWKNQDVEITKRFFQGNNYILVIDRSNTAP